MSGSLLTATCINKQPSSMQSGIIVGSLNCMLLPVIRAPRRRARLLANWICKNLHECDVVVLQEVFSNAGKKILLSITQHLFPYIQGPVRAKGFFTNSGLLFLSKTALSNFTFRVYEARKPWTFDWFVSKGFASVDVMVDTGRTVRIFGTHMQSGSKKLGAVKAQALSLARAITKKAQPQMYIVAGDMNYGLGYLRRHLEEASGTKLSLCDKPTLDPRTNTMAKWLGDTHPECLDAVWVVRPLPPPKGMRMRNEVLEVKTKPFKMGLLKMTHPTDHHAVMLRCSHV